MSYQAEIVRAERVSKGHYKLVTANNEYSYECIDTKGKFQEEEESWKARVLESQEILLEWIENQKPPCPACICWNSEGNALLEVKLTTLYNPTYNMQISEINPYVFKDAGDWVADPACPILLQNLAKLNRMCEPETMHSKDATGL